MYFVEWMFSCDIFFCSILESRIRDYVLLSMTSQTLQTPTFSVLSPIQNELREATTKFVRVVSHNKKVHQQRYLNMVEELLANEKEGNDGCDQTDSVTTDNDANVACKNVDSESEDTKQQLIKNDEDKD